MYFYIILKSLEKSAITTIGNAELTTTKFQRCKNEFINRKLARLDVVGNFAHRLGFPPPEHSRSAFHPWHCIPPTLHATGPRRAVGFWSKRFLTLIAQCFDLRLLVCLVGLVAKQTHLEKEQLGMVLYTPFQTVRHGVYNRGCARKVARRGEYSTLCALTCRINMQNRSGSWYSPNWNIIRSSWLRALAQHSGMA